MIVAVKGALIDQILRICDIDIETDANLKLNRTAVVLFHPPGQIRIVTGRKIR
jgi:hypothetical protein